MKIDLKKKLNMSTMISEKTCIDERLPNHVVEPFEMYYQYHVEDKGDYFLLKLQESANIPIYCQRCMQAFTTDYQLVSELAICPNEQMAEKYQSSYDVIVANDYLVDFKEILIDNVYLFSPQFHLQLADCDQNHVKLMQND